MFLAKGVLECGNHPCINHLGKKFGLEQNEAIYLGLRYYLIWCHIKRNNSLSLILQIIYVKNRKSWEHRELSLDFLPLFQGRSSNRSTDSKATHVSTIKPQIPQVSPATWEHLDLGQVRISPYIPSGTSSQVCSLMQQPGVATYLAAVLQFCTISCAQRCFSSSNTAPHITHSGMRLTCAPISVRICIVLLMHLHLLLSLYSPPWRIYFLSMWGGFLSISLCNAPGGKETPCLIDSPDAEVGILSSRWMLQVLCDLQDRFR